MGTGAGTHARSFLLVEDESGTHPPAAVGGEKEKMGFLPSKAQVGFCMVDFGCLIMIFVKHELVVHVWVKLPAPSRGPPSTFNDGRLLKCLTLSQTNMGFLLLSVLSPSLSPQLWISNVGVLI